MFWFSGPPLVLQCQDCKVRDSSSGNVIFQMISGCRCSFLIRYHVVDVWFHSQCSPRAVNTFCAAYGTSECSCVGSVYFGGSAGAGVYHEGCGNVWVRFS